MNAMGYIPYETTNIQSNMYPNVATDIPAGGYPQGNKIINLYSLKKLYEFLEGFGNTRQYNSQNFTNIPNNPRQNFNEQQVFQNSFTVSPNLSMLGQPVVQDMAMQYGQQVGCLK